MIKNILMKTRLCFEKKKTMTIEELLKDRVTIVCIIYKSFISIFNRKKN